MLTSALSRIAARVTQAVSDWRTHSTNRVTMADMKAMSDHQLNDLGLTRGDLDRFDLTGQVGLDTVAPAPSRHAANSDVHQVERRHAA